LKFSDVILAAATTVVIYGLIYFVFGFGLISFMSSYWAEVSTIILSLLVAGLVGGLVFAGKIQEESRIRAVGKIAVLFAAATMFLTVITFSANSYFGANVKETLQSMYSTGAWTTTDWFTAMQLATFIDVALQVVFTLVFGSIGLYAGSMLRKPKKT